MAAINFGPLDGVFNRTEGQRVELGRSIHRFQLNPQVQMAAVSASITTFLQNNPNLVLVSKPLAGEDLAGKATRCPHLTINGDAVCLSDKLKSPDHVDLLAKDAFFSEAFIEEPIQCPRGHVFEREYIEAWVELKGDLCPFQGNHVVGAPLEVDPYLAERVRAIREYYRHQEAVNRASQEDARQALDGMALQNARITALQAAIKPDRTFDIAGGAMKIVVKGGALAGARMVCKTSECALHSFVKKVPVVSVIFGCILAVHRCRQGYRTNSKAEYGKAVGEIVSGVAACFPGYGTAASISIDVAMAGHDIYEINRGQVSINLDVANAHRTLGLDPANQATREQIDEGFRRLSFLAHPDRMARFGEYTQLELNDLQATLTMAKNALYDHYGYARHVAAAET